LDELVIEKNKKKVDGTRMVWENRIKELGIGSI
jgi:hypothetical protein